MLEFCILRDKPVEEFFKITARGRICIFHDDQAATGVSHKNCDEAVPNVRFMHQRCDAAGNLVSAFSGSRDDKILAGYLHATAS